MSSTTHAEIKTAPVKATWITLVIAWVLFLVPIPGVGLFVGWTLNLVAFILAIVVMVRGRTAGGLIPLLCSIVVSPIVYFIGLAVFGAAISQSSYKDYADRAKAAGSNAPAAAETASAPLVQVTATDLYAAYHANEVSADNAYKGKRLAVTGTVAGINKDFSNKVYVSLSGGDESGLDTVTVRGLKEDIAANLSKGQVISVECKGAGMVMTVPGLDDCSMQ